MDPLEGGHGEHGHDHGRDHGRDGREEQGGQGQGEAVFRKGCGEEALQEGAPSHLVCVDIDVDKSIAINTDIDR